MLYGGIVPFSFAVSFFSILVIAALIHQTFFEERVERRHFNRNQMIISTLEGELNIGQVSNNASKFEQIANSSGNQKIKKDTSTPTIKQKVYKKPGTKFLHNQTVA